MIVRLISKIVPCFALDGSLIINEYTFETDDVINVLAILTSFEQS